MQRGDIVSVALQGNAGKPRPALVIQSDLLDAAPTVLVIPFSSTVIHAATVRRVTIRPDPVNGLEEVSQLMIERMTSALRSKCGRVFGRITADQMSEVEIRVAFALGLSEVGA